MERESPKGPLTERSDGPWLSDGAHTCMHGALRLVDLVAPEEGREQHARALVDKSCAETLKLI